MSEMRARIESLSPRQLQVMHGVACRLSSKEIGLHLGLSPATVDSHIAAALQRMQLTSRRDAALHLIELGYATEFSTSDLSLGAHHGGDAPPQSSSIANVWRRRIFRSSSERGRGRGGLLKGKANGPSSHAIKPGMGRAVVRFLLDGFYISLFFTVMSAVAFGAHWVVIQCEQRNIDPIVLFILKSVSYVLAGLDAVGVITATGFLTYRFIRAIVRADA